MIKPEVAVARKKLHKITKKPDLEGNPKTLMWCHPVIKWVPVRVWFLLRFLFMELFFLPPLSQACFLGMYAFMHKCTTPVIYPLTWICFVSTSIVKRATQVELNWIESLFIWVTPNSVIINVPFYNYNLLHNHKVHLRKQLCWAT